MRKVGRVVKATDC